MSKHSHDRRARRRLDRQIEQIARALPSLRRPLDVLRARGWWIIRLPIALILIVGGVLSFLPLLGFWMLPLGLLLLAIDLPALRGPISAVMIRARRRFTLWRRARTERRRK